MWLFDLGYHPVPWNWWYCQLLWPWWGTSTSYIAQCSFTNAKINALIVACTIHSSVHAQFQNDWSSQTLTLTCLTTCYRHAVTHINFPLRKPQSLGCWDANITWPWQAVGQVRLGPITFLQTKHAHEHLELIIRTLRVVDTKASKPGSLQKASLSGQTSFLYQYKLMFHWDFALFISISVHSMGIIPSL